MHKSTKRWATGVFAATLSFAMVAGAPIVAFAAEEEPAIAAADAVEATKDGDPAAGAVAVSAEQNTVNIGFEGVTNNDENMVTFTFDANGGTGTMDALVLNKESKVNLPKNTFSRDGYEFVGWGLAAETPEDSYIADEAEQNAMLDTTYYAQWKKVEPAERPSITYAAHSQTYGWKTMEGKDGTSAGTTGESKRLEAIKVNKVQGITVSYRSHVQPYGWETNWVSSDKEDAFSGTSGQSKRLEAIQMNLDETSLKKFHIWYRVHCQTYGWLGWTSDGGPAGTSGQSKRLEAYQVMILPLDETPEDYDPTKPAFVGFITGEAHIQTFGWQNTEQVGILGTEGLSKRIEALRLSVSNQAYKGGIEYKTHVQTYGWEKSFAADGELSGTTGQSKRIEAIRMNLTGDMSLHFSVWYRVHAQSYGWLGWARDGEPAGTSGLSKRAEAFEIQILPIGAKPITRPGTETNMEALHKG